MLKNIVILENGKNKIGSLSFRRRRVGIFIKFIASADGKVSKFYVSRYLSEIRTRCLCHYPLEASREKV